MVDTSCECRDCRCEEEELYVCRHDGVLVTTSKTNRLVHAGELPRGTPEHEIAITSRALYEANFKVKADLRTAVADFMEHHATLHPVADCPWVENVQTALRATMA